MVTEILHTAFFALRPAGDADRAPVQNEAVAEIVRLFHRQDRAQIFFHLEGFFVFRQPQQRADPDTVGIGNDRRLAENIRRTAVVCYERSCKAG